MCVLLYTHNIRCVTQNLYCVNFTLFLLLLFVSRTSFFPFFHFLIPFLSLIPSFSLLYAILFMSKRKINLYFIRFLLVVLVAFACIQLAEAHVKRDVDVSLDTKAKVRHCSFSFEKKESKRKLIVIK